MVEITDPKNRPNAGLPAYQGSGKTEDIPIEDMNTTMMGVEVGGLQDETRQNMNKMEWTDSGVEPVEKLQETPAPEPWYKKILPQRFSFLPKRVLSKHSENKSTSLFVGSWIPEDSSRPFEKIFFYISRLWIVVFGVLAQYVLLQAALKAYQDQHPARLVILIAAVVSVLLLLLAVVRRASPVYMFTLPFSGLAIVFAYGAAVYESSDAAYFALAGHTVASLLNAYFVCILLLLVFLFYGGQTRRQIGRVIWGVFLALTFAPLILQLIQNVDFPSAFWGYGVFYKIKSSFFQPAFLFAHALLPLWLILVVLKSFLPNRFKSITAAYRALVPLFLTATILGFAVMQEMRVFHLANLFLPQRLAPAFAEFDDRGHKVELKTKALPSSLNPGRRYRFQIQENPTQKQYDFDVFQGSKTVRGLVKSDFAVWVDGVATEDFTITPRTEGLGYAFKTDLKTREQAIVMGPIAKTASYKDAIEVTILDPDRLQKLAYVENNQTLFEKQAPFAEKWQIPLASFSSGDHQGSVVAYDANGAELIRFQAKFALPQKKAFFLVSPFAEDDVGSVLPVRLGLSGMHSADIQKLVCRIGDRIVYESPAFLSSFVLDLSAFADGPLAFRVEITTAEGVLSQDLSLRKTNKILPELTIVSPVQGSFASDETPVLFELQGSSSRVLGVRVAVNGGAFEDFEMRENRFVLPVKRWRDQEIYVALQGTLETGEKISDWLQINRGAAQLKVQFQGVTSLFTAQKKLAVVLDATQNGIDHWYGRLVWDAIKEGMLAGEVQNKLSEQAPEFWVFGATRPAYFEDCKDVHSLDIANFSRAVLKKKLDEVSPVGTGSVVHAVKKALAIKPDKILVVTQGFSECGDSVADLAALWDESAKPRLSVVLLRPLAHAEQDALAAFVQKTQGGLYTPANPEALITALSDDLNVTFTLSSTTETLREGPLKDQEFSLSPGDYTLRLPLPTGVKEIPIHLDHGLKKTLTVSGKSGKLQIEESSSPMP